MHIYLTINEYEIMLKQIDHEIKDEEHINIIIDLQKLKSHYHNTLYAFKEQKNFHIVNDTTSKYYQEKEWRKLLNLVTEIENYKLKQKFYHYLSQDCSRLIMIPYRQIIQLMDWRTQFKILRNMKVIFSEVVDIDFGHNNSIVALYVSRGKNSDRLTLCNGPISTQKIGKHGKFIKHIESEVNRSLSAMVKNCNGRVGQMKILHWHLYFTEQVEQHIITSTSLKQLESRLQETIS